MENSELNDLAALLRRRPQGFPVLCALSAEEIGQLREAIVAAQQRHERALDAALPDWLRILLPPYEPTA